MEFINVPLTKDSGARKEWEAVVWQELCEWFTRQDVKTLKSTLELITSLHERQLMVKRAAAIAHIRNGKSYKEIGRELWIAPQTISSIKKGLAGQNYVSNWGKAKSQRRARQPARLNKSSERPVLKHYRRNKYGKVRIL